MKVTGDLDLHGRSVVQVGTGHYEFERYVSKARWASYYEQLRLVANSGLSSVLVVGPGDGIVPAALRSMGHEVTTLDFDASLSPDIVGDVRELTSSTGFRRFDVVMCCQVLEHLPFEEFERCLRALLLTARRYLILSLPSDHIRLASISLNPCGLGAAIINILVPRFWRRWRFDGEHYWEIGAQGFGLRTIKRIIEGQAIIRKCYRLSSNPYHIFFMIEGSGINER